MVLNFAAKLLNRLKWTKQLPDSEIIILHRGAPENKKSIRGNHITEIKKGYFSYMDTEKGKETTIPMHRVLEIWMQTKLVWKKRARKPAARKTKKANNPKRVKRRKATTRKRRSHRKKS